ncbi:hypothetical protein CYMTET_54527 [Cymbomonas tetramitiformis]|uniref:Uncharacterized protein n=1 Tax=Cymbomonas tetramitiformis TaxID=36881 RepID=A0AAE0BF16_9CHLO|nr:hypothetical protein CYMTET_54527 [Cymbomonas tetramitiformis]
MLNLRLPSHSLLSGSSGAVPESLGTAYLTFFTAVGFHWLVILKIPPSCNLTNPDLRCKRQMTCHGTSDGLDALGVKYTSELYVYFQPPEAELREDCCYGHRMKFVEKPKRLKRDNNPLCYQDAERSDVEHIQTCS